jgi:hypothetical protein
VIAIAMDENDRAEPALHRGERGFVRKGAQSDTGESQDCGAPDNRPSRYAHLYDLPAFYVRRRDSPIESLMAM